MKHGDQSSSQLFNKLQAIQPHLTKVYVATVLKSTLKSETNQYLNLIYQDHVQQNIDIVRLLDDNYSGVFLQRLKKEKAVVHYHWFQCTSRDMLLPVIKTFFWFLVFRFAGIKVIWTIHNRTPHIKRFLTINKWLRILFEKLSYRNHVHCHCAIREMVQILQAKEHKFFVIPHPDYQVTPLPRESAFKVIKKKYSMIDAKVSTLDITHCIYLMFGQIRPYKGIMPIAQVFLAEKVPSHLKLIIAGIVRDEQYGCELEYIARQSENIVYIPTFIPDEDESAFYSLTDYVVLNHQGTLTSGAAVLALNYEKDILVPNVCCLNELEGSRTRIFNTIEDFKTMILETKS